MSINDRGMQRCRPSEAELFNSQKWGPWKYCSLGNLEAVNTHYFYFLLFKDKFSPILIQAWENPLLQGASEGFLV